MIIINIFVGPRETTQFAIPSQGAKRGFLTKRCGKMRKKHKKREKMGKETIRYWKSANDIIVVNFSVHSNNLNEYMQAYRYSRPSACVV